MITRSPTGRSHPKLREVLHPDFFNFESLRADFTGCDACFFCLGITLGLSEVAYTRVTYDIAMAAAREMVAANPRMTFCFVSGVGTDSTEKGRTMWARVKGKTENALLRWGSKPRTCFGLDTFSRSAMCNRKQDGCRRRTTSPGHSTR